MSDVDVVIATPFFGDPPPEYWLSLIKVITNDFKLREDAKFDKYNLGIIHREGFPLDEIRNTLVEDFLEITDYNKNPDSRMLLVDSDAYIPQETVNELFQWDVDIVTAINVKTSKPHKITSFIQKEDGYHHVDIEFGKDLVDIDATGMHCIMVKRKVFETIKKPYFKHITGGLSEDMYFSKKVKDSGFKIWLDTNISTGHIGRKLYGYVDYYSYRVMGVSNNEKEGKKG